MCPPSRCLMRPRKTWERLLPATNTKRLASGGMIEAVTPTLRLISDLGSLFNFARDALQLWELVLAGLDVEASKLVGYWAKDAKEHRARGWRFTAFKSSQTG